MRNIIIFFVSIFTVVAGVSGGRIESSPHDFRAVGSSSACDFCHTPHGALKNTPVWNHKLSKAVYKIYQSSSLDAKVGQPTGPSKLCLSCHDGTVALGQVRRGKPSNAGARINPGSANLGTDLSDDHPISFVYSSGLSARDPQIHTFSSIPSVLRLDNNQELQCTTCHDSHDNTFGDFLVMDNRKSVMCRSCHDLDQWDLSSHERSSASVASAGDSYLRQSKYHTVSDNGCLSCHRPHSAGGNERLLHFAKSEDNCLNCHDGSVASSNLKSDLNKAYRHNVYDFSGVHDLKESVTSSEEHVECVDCHNPHSVESGSSSAPHVQPSLGNVSGVTESGSVVHKARYEYEVCFKCHGSNPNRIESPITRQITQTDTRLEFDPSGPSHHPVVSTGKNQNVPSLQPSLTESTMIYCSSCHSSDGGSGTSGPHGSSYKGLLAYNYSTSDFTQESESSYKLCYQCHRRNSILNDESFSEHSKHLEEEIPCSACHDAHGISLAQGSEQNNVHLINFDISIVDKSSTGLLKFEDMGVFHGRCYLKCHGEDHLGEEY